MTIRAGDRPPSHAASDDNARADEASMRRELGSLREVDPPPALVARVMTGLAAAAPPTLWQWLRRPIRIELALSPLAAVLLGVGLAAGGAAVGWRAQQPPPAFPSASSEVQAAATTVRVRFTYRAPGAHKVAVAGSFNGWSPESLLLEEAEGDGLFVGSAPLPAGLHEYMFVVDGQWVTDPDSPLRRPDGFGRQNSLLRI